MSLHEITLDVHGGWAGGRVGGYSLNPHVGRQNKNIRMIVA